MKITIVEVNWVRRPSIQNLCVVLSQTVLFRKPQCHYASTCTTMTRMNIHEQVKYFDDFTHPDSHKIYGVIFSL